MVGRLLSLRDNILSGALWVSRTVYIQPKMSGYNWYTQFLILGWRFDPQKTQRKQPNLRPSPSVLIWYAGLKAGLQEHKTSWILAIWMPYIIYIHTHLTYVFIYWDSPPSRKHIVTARNMFHFWVTRHAKLNLHFPRLHPGRGLAPINGCIYLQRFPSKQRNLYKIVCMSVVETSCSRTNLHPVHL